jgi:hypothetical protein
MKKEACQTHALYLHHLRALLSQATRVLAHLKEQPLSGLEVVAHMLLCPGTLAEFVVVQTDLWGACGVWR